VNRIHVKISPPAKVQEREREREKDIVFIAGGIGIGNTTKSSEDRSGMNTAIRLGLKLSRSLALSLDYEVNDRNDEKPLSTDFVKSGNSFKVARRPKVFSTKYTFICIQANLSEGFFIRSSVGLGFHRLASYDEVYGAIDPNTRKRTIDGYEGRFSSGAGVAFGLSAGYELIRMRAFSFALEGTYRISLSGDSSRSRRALSMHGLVALRL
jgi:hypothetical protein